jgi:hypothetical protein
MFSESSIPEARMAGDERPEGAPRRWQRIFPILILAGMILIGIAMLFLLAGSTPAHASDTCVWIARL